MRKLILETQISLDGYVARNNGSTDWMIWNWGAPWTWDPALREYHTDLTKSIDCILLSKQMAAEGFNDHWQNVTEDIKDPRYEFACHVIKTKKIVFSKTLTKSTPIPDGWNNTDIAAGDFSKFINKLKAKSGKNIIVYGGASFVSSLIRSKLIDEFHFVVNPVLLGEGLSIFKEVGEQKLKLIRSQMFGDGIVVLHYKV